MRILTIYQYKDYLENIKLLYSDDNNYGEVGADTEIKQERNYYSFDLRMCRFNNAMSGTVHSYGFVGKEGNNKLGLE